MFHKSLPSSRRQTLTPFVLQMGYLKSLLGVASRLNAPSSWTSINPSSRAVQMWIWNYLLTHPIISVKNTLPATDIYWENTQYLSQKKITLLKITSRFDMKTHKRCSCTVAWASVSIQTVICREQRHLKSPWWHLAFGAKWAIGATTSSDWHFTGRGCECWILNQSPQLSVIGSVQKRSV